jgi:TP901 family phage tail tape measure protein
MVAVGKDMQNVGKALTKTVTVPILAVGAGLLKLGQDFQDAENTIRVGTGATGKSLQDLNDSFKKVYGQVPTTMADASKAVADLNTKLGITGKPLEDLSAQMLNLARITKTDLATDITAATRMFQDAGIKQEDYSKALDYTFKVTQNTGIGIDSLQQLMTQFGGPLRQMGFDWQTSAAMLGKFQKEGVNTELVVGSLRIALGKMAKKGVSDPAAALQDIVTKIKAAGTAGKANALALDMFGAKAGPDMAAAIREGHLDLSGLLQTLKNSPDTINDAAAATMRISEKFSLLKQQMAIAFEPVGTKLLDSFDKLMPTIQKVAEKVADFAKRLADMSPAQQEMIVKFALVAAAAGPVIVMLGSIVRGVGDTIGPFMKLSKSISNAGGIMAYLAGPGGTILLVIAAIAALIAIGVLLYTHWDEIKKKATELHSEFVNLKDNAIGKVKTEFQNLMDKVKDVKDTLTDLKDKAVKDAKKIFEDFTQTLKDHQAAIKTTATILGTVFAPAIIKTGIESAISAGKIAGSFIASIAKTGLEAVIAAGKVTISFIASMAEAGLKAVIVAPLILTGFVAAVIASGVEAVISAGKITVSFVASLIETGSTAIATGGMITLSLIGSLIAYAAQGWATVAVIAAQTLGWLVQKGMMIASATVYGVMTAAQWALNIAMDANPIGAVIILIGLLVAAGVLLYQNWGTVKQVLSDAWVNIKNSFTEGINFCIGLIDQFIGTLNKIPGVNIPILSKISLDVSGNSTAAGMQAGRNALGTSYWGGGETWVGENGPEKVTLPKGSKVQDHQSSVNSSGKSISIAKLADMIIVREEADIEKIAKALAYELKNAAFNMS